MSARIELLVLLITPTAPLLLAIAMMLRPDAAGLQRFAALAAVPALATSWLMPSGIAATLPWLLEGSEFGLDDTSRLFLFFTSVLWMAGAAYARQSIRPAGRMRFFVYFMLTMTGNFGLILARDMLAFYLFFTVMSLSAYGLIAHDRSTAAGYAARVYMTLVIAGDLMLYAALVLTALDTGGYLLFEAARSAIADSPRADTILLLVALGFGVKIGVIGLHVSLPLIYSSAPIPGAAVLAGAVINGGLLGWMRMLPLGTAALAGWGRAFVTAGIVAAFYGVLVGLAERRPKAVLAYSSISQMGIMTLGLGFGLLAPAAVPQIITAVAIYAMHHGFAKSALFLGAGVAQRATTGGWRLLAGAGLLLPALALCGAPLTSGMLAKELLKEVFETAPATPGWLISLLPWTAFATTLIMMRFLWLTWPHHASRARRPDKRMTGAWLMVVALVLTGTWLVPGTARPALSAAMIWSASWPVLLGICVAAVASRILHAPRLPRGDVLVLGTLATRLLLRGWRLLSVRWTPAARERVSRPARAVRRHPLWLTLLERTEALLGRWPVSSALFVALILVLAGSAIMT